MATLCPDCRKGPMQVKAAIELPPDSRSDEVTLSVLECPWFVSGPGQNLNMISGTVVSAV